MKAVTLRKSLAALVTIGMFVSSISVLADEPAANPEAAPPSATSELADQAMDGREERRFPVQRELSVEDYQWLGQVVWQTMLAKVPIGQQRGLNRREIGALVEAMRRNRDEFNVQLEDLMRILSSRVKVANEARQTQNCQAQPAAENFGFDLARLKKPEH